MAGFDTKKVSPIDWGVIGGGALALVSLFLPWWGVQSSVAGLRGSASGSGWEVGFGAWFGALLVAAAGALVLIRYIGRQLPALPVGEYTLVAGLATLGAILILLRVVTFKAANLGVIEYGRKLGAWVGLLAAVVAAGAAIKRFMDSGEKPAWDASKMPGGAATRVDTSGYVPPADSSVYPAAPPSEVGAYPPPPPPVAAPDAGHHDLNGHDHQH